MTGSIYFSIMPLDCLLHIVAKKHTRYVSPQGTQLYFNQPIIISLFIWLGVVCISAYSTFRIAEVVLTGPVCAINTNDEEKCITVARHLMRDGGISDSSRMFALLSRLCQSPVSWYTSGPAQKFILRQIKAIDMSYEAITKNAGNNDFDQDATAAAKMNMDICLLMLYGHILFTSTSYTYAIGEHEKHPISTQVVARELTTDNRILSACVVT